MHRIINKFIESFGDMPIEIKGLIYLLAACLVLLMFNRPVEIIPALICSIPSNNKGTAN